MIMHSLRLIAPTLDPKNRLKTEKRQFTLGAQYLLETPTKLKGQV